MWIARTGMKYKSAGGQGIWPRTPPNGLLFLQLPVCSVSLLISQDAHGMHSMVVYNMYKKHPSAQTLIRVQT